MPSLIMVLEAFTINFVVGLIIPAAKIGDKLALHLKANAGTFKFMAPVALKLTKRMVAES